jgi:hypothetical protein
MCIVAFVIFHTEDVFSDLCAKSCPWDSFHWPPIAKINTRVMNLHSVKFGIKIFNKPVWIEYKTIWSIISNLKHYEGTKVYKSPHIDPLNTLLVPPCHMAVIHHYRINLREVTMECIFTSVIYQFSAHSSLRQTSLLVACLFPIYRTCKWLWVWFSYIKTARSTPKKYLYCFTLHLLVYCVCTAVHEARCLRILCHELQSIIHSQLEAYYTY